jgi:protein-L-isoaspartate(D-aspartate) O-methyltransferase
MGDDPVDDPPDAATARERETMVASQLRRRGIADERVLAAMSAIPRERFVDAATRQHAYDDAALPIAAGQSISQPYMVARMTELLAVRPGDRILEIGTGSGYQAAILATLGARVLSVERHPGLAEEARKRLAELGLADRVEIRVGDGSLGAPEDGPFDGIVVTAAAPRIPEAFLDQLADGGRLVIPVGPRDRQRLIVATRHGNTWDERSEGDCVFVPLVGAGGWPK